MKQSSNKRKKTGGYQLFHGAWVPTGFLVILSLISISCVTTIGGIKLDIPVSGSGERVSNQDAIAALRDALKEGAKSAGSRLSKQDGYFGDAAVKILMPPEAKKLMDVVGKIPQGKKMVDDVVLRLNRAAEQAAREVVPIFVDAITSMTVADGIAIIKGGDHAATEYLESKTRDKLFRLYRPRVNAALAKPLVGDVSAKRSWEVLTGAYNKAGKLPNKAARFAGKPEPMPAIEVDLADYATNKGLDGLFVYIGREEEKIRDNPAAYASAMIKKVFGALKAGAI